MSVSTDLSPLDDLTLEVEEEHAPEVHLSPLGALMGVLFRPLDTFRRMREAQRGHWWIVPIVALVGVALLAIAQAPIQAEQQRAIFEANREAMAQFASSPDEAEQAAQMQAYMGSQTTLAMWGIIGGVIGLLIGYLVHAGFLFLLGMIMGGRATFKQVFRMAIWTTLPGALRNLISAVAVFTTGRLPAPGLSSALTSGEILAQPILAAVLQYFDLYQLWMLALIGVGVAATNRLSRGKSLLVVLIYWLVTLGLALAGTAAGMAVGQAFGGM